MRDFLSSPDWLVEFLCLKVFVFSPREGVLLKMVMLCFLASGRGFTFHRQSGRWAKEWASGTASSCSPGCLSLGSAHSSACSSGPAPGSLPCISPADFLLLSIFTTHFCSRGRSLYVLFETELQSLKLTGSPLAEHLSKENPQGEPHIGLGISQGDLLLL